MFSTLMFERHQTKIAIFGGKPGLPMEFKGTNPSVIREGVIYARLMAAVTIRHGRKSSFGMV